MASPTKPGAPASTWYTDGDGDSYGDPATATDACSAAADQVADRSDCDDTDALVNPVAAESCNGVDDDCDGGVDIGLTTTYYQDVDLDGYGDVATSLEACGLSVGWVTDGTDCDDVDDTVNPAAAEVCDTIDNDCDSVVDEAGAFGEDDWYTDADGDGYGDPPRSRRSVMRRPTACSSTATATMPARPPTPARWKPATARTTIVMLRRLKPARRRGGMLRGCDRCHGHARGRHRRFSRRDRRCKHRRSGD